MLFALRKRLTILYSVSTGIIITAMVIITLIFSISQLNQQNKDLFSENINILVNQLQRENAISHSFISQLESKNNLIIYIEDNNIPLSYEGFWSPATDRKWLIQKTKELAQEEGIDSSTYPFTTSIVNSSIFKFNGYKKEVYIGGVTIIPSAKGWRTLVLVRYLPNEYTQKIRLFLLFAFIDGIGLLLLFIVSWILMGKVLKPIEESRKKQTEFVAAASHELRSPLTVISASVSAILVDTSQIPHFVSGIESECKRMARLIDDMLILASADAKTWSVNKKQIDIDTFLIETFELFLPLCHNKKQHLYLEFLEENPISVLGDEQRLFQAITILLDNAMSYTPVGGKIVLRAYNKLNLVCLEVEDNGIGIPDEFKELVFDRFYRKDSSRNEKSHFGLGLSIAKELIILHGGIIYIKDTKGGGSTFVIEINKKLNKQ